MASDAIEHLSPAWLKRHASDSPFSEVCNGLCLFPQLCILLPQAVAETLSLPLLCLQPLPQRRDLSSCRLCTPTYSSVSVEFLETNLYNGHAWLLQVEWQVAQKPAQAQLLATQKLSSVTQCNGEPRAFLPLCARCSSTSTLSSLTGLKCLPRQVALGRCCWSVAGRSQHARRGAVRC